MCAVTASEATMNSSTPEARTEAARAAIDQALADLATAYRAHRAATKDLLRAAYVEGGGGESGTRRQSAVSAGRYGTTHLAKSIVRRLRKLGMGLVLDHARVR
jgi:hypothetical protein